MGIALESLQGKRDLIQACVQELIFLSRGDRNLGIAFKSHPESQASSRGEAKDSALLLSRDGYLLEPTEWPKGSSLLWSLERGLDIALQAIQGKKALFTR